jgi:hypothetical protein
MNMAPRRRIGVKIRHISEPFPTCLAEMRENERC